jgi:hypothetical protein
MERRKVLAIGMGMFLMLSVCIGISTIHLQMVQGDPVFRQIQGIVDPNSTTGVRPYDLVQNGFVYYYIQNRTNEGNGTDPMTTNPAPPPIVDYYDPAISSGINDWQVGDECILVVDREYGSYGTDHAGYVAFMNVTLVATGGVQFAPTTELKKIPVPIMVSNGTGWIEISWDALDDPNGLIAGYKVYRSETNGTVLGDDDWTLVGGTVNAPLTVTNYNDTSVVGGTTYYYSVKVVFTGYKNDDPLQVENYQNQIFGEGSGEMSSEVSIYTVNYFTLTTGPAPNGPELTTEFLDVGETIQIWASGYNNSVVPNPYVSPVVVDWSQSPSLGSFSTYTGDNTIFTAGYYQGGTTTITGENLAMTPTTDTGDVTVNPPIVDYILLTYSPNGTEILDMPWNTGDPLLIYASGYNETAFTYVDLVDVTWSDTPALGGFDNATGTSSTYTGTSSGLTTIKGESGTLNDTFDLNLVGIDYIELTDAPNGNILDIADLVISENITVYASGYSTSVGYLNVVNVGWTLTPIGALGYIDNITGTSTTFFANFTAGGLVLNGTDPTKPSLTDEITVNILEPTLDYILLTNTEDGTPYNLATQTLNINSFMDIFASGYNNTGPTYVGLIDVDWTESALPPLGSFNVTPSDTVRFTAGGTTGMTTIKGENLSLGVVDSFVLDIVQLTIDYINITDEPNGVKITAVSLDVGETVTLYASGYSSLTTPNTYLGPVEVDWTNLPDLGDFSVDLGTSTVFTAGLVGGTTTIKGENTSMTPTVSDTFPLTIRPPTVDYIIIVDTSGTGTEVIANQTVDVGVTITGYAASFNNTALYIGDVQVTWSVTNEDDATASTDPELNSPTSDFYSGNHQGTATWTAVHAAGPTDVVVFTINPPIFDYIRIETKTGGAGEEVDTAEFRIGESYQYYCAGYNNSVGYIEDKSAAWSVDVVIGTFDTTPGTFTQFTATTAGEGIITASFTYDSTTITDSTGTISVYPGPPTAPTGLVVSQVASGEALDLAWNANPESYDIVYNIWRSPTGASGTFSEIASYVSDTSYTDTGLTNGNTYYYHIIAMGDFPAPNASVPSEAANNVADADTDGDEIFNLQDTDDDGDGLLDTEEDKNGDGLIEGDTNNNRIWDNGEDWKETDPLNSDTDGDTHNDKEDYYPLDPDKWKKEEDEFPIMLVLIPIIIIIIILILLMLLLKKRKPAEIPAVPEEERELPPPPGAPVEEEEGALPEEEELPPEEEAPPEGEEELPEEEMPPEEEIPESEKETPP